MNNTTKYTNDPSVKTHVLMDWHAALMILSGRAPDNNDALLTKHNDTVRTSAREVALHTLADLVAWRRGYASVIRYRVQRKEITDLLRECNFEDYQGNSVAEAHEYMVSWADAITFFSEVNEHLS